MQAQSCEAETEGRSWSTCTVSRKVRSGQWGVFEPKSPIKGVPHFKVKAFLGFLPALNHRLRAARGKQGLGANAVQADMRTEGEMGRSVGKKKMRENLGME